MVNVGKCTIHGSYGLGVITLFITGDGAHLVVRGMFFVVKTQRADDFCFWSLDLHSEAGYVTQRLKHGIKHNNGGGKNTF